MIPLNPLASWRKCAQAFRPAEFGFAMGAGFCDALKMRGLQASDCGAPNCDPFPSTWPDPLRVRLFLLALGRVIAERLHGSRDISFSIRGNALELVAITILKRGSKSCSRLPLSLWRLPHRFCPAVSARTATRLATAQQCAPLVVRRQVPLSLMQPAVAKPRARLSAHSLAACRAAFRACPLATDYDRRLGGTGIHHKRPSGVAPRMAFLHLRPGFWSGRGKTEGTAPCSRKS